MRSLAPALLLAATLMGSGDGAEENVRSVAYATRFGGSQYDTISDIVTDKEGNLYITGTTRSADLPLKNPLQHAIGGDEGLDDRGRVSPGSVSGGYHGFVAKLRGDGTSYEYVTHIDSSASNHVEAVTVDTNGQAYAGGRGGSTCALKPTLDAFSTPEGCLFVAKLAADDGSVEWLSRFGGTDDGKDYEDIAPAYISDMALDAQSNVYLTGATSSRDFPTTSNAAQRSLHVRRIGGSIYDGFDAFLTKLTADGSALSYSTFLGGSSGDFAGRLAVDTAGLVHVAGVSDSEDLAGRSYTNSRDRGQLFCCWDAFAARMSADGSAFIDLNVFGGSFSDGAQGVAVSPQGLIWMAGYTFSPDLPTTPAAGDLTTREGSDGFVVKLPWRGTPRLAR